jgi:hypothetical protein
MKDTSSASVGTEHARRTPRFWLIVVLLALAVLAGLAILWTSWSTTTISGDDAVRSLFQKRRAVFYELRDMIMSEPNLRGVGEDYIAMGGQGKELPYWRQDGQWITDPTRGQSQKSSDEILSSNKVPPDRYAKYLRLLADVKGDRLERDDREGSVSILLGASGIAPSGQAKSVVFFPNGVPSGYTAVMHTDAQTSKGKYCSSLGDGWYIELRCW